MRRLPAALAALLLMLASAGCSRAPVRYQEYRYEFFDTVCRIIGYETSQARFREAADGVWAILADYDRLCDRYGDDDGADGNGLRTLNDHAGGEPMALDDRLLAILDFGKEMYELTGGAVNIAMGSVLTLWHDCRAEAAADPEHAAVPTPEALAAAAGHTDIRCLLIDRELGTACLTDPEMSLDLGAVAKGWAAERCAEWLKAEGFDGYALDLGGNLRLLGRKGDGSPWVAGVQDPTGDAGASDYLCRLSLVGGSLVTSGSYQRYFTADGVRYHHIISPETLFPSNTYVSVTVLTPDSAAADALSTALFNLTPEEGQALIASLPDTEAFWVLPDGTSFASAGWSAFLTV